MLYSVFYSNSKNNTKYYTILFDFFLEKSMICNEITKHFSTRRVI